MTGSSKGLNLAKDTITKNVKSNLMVEEPVQFLEKLREEVSLLKASYGDSLATQNYSKLVASPRENISKAPIDFKWLSLQPNLPLLILAFSPQHIQSSIRLSGFDMSMEIVENLKGNQLAKVLDIDVWESNGSDVFLSTHKMGEWLRAWLEIDSEFAAARVLEMDEEFLLHFIVNVLDIKPLGIQYSKMDYDQLPDGDWILSHNKAFHFKVKEHLKADLEDIVLQLTESLFSADLKLTGRIFAYAAMLNETEIEEQAKKWRLSRIADVGFVSREEAQSQLKFVGVQKVLSSYIETLNAAKVQPKIKTQPFTYDYDLFDDVVKTLSKLDAEVAAQQIRLISTEKHLSALVGTVSISDEMLQEDEEVLNDVAEDFCTQSGVLVAAGLQNYLSEFGSGEWKYSELLEIQNCKAELSKLCNLVSSYLLVGDVSNSHIVQEFSAQFVRGALSVGVEVLANDRALSVETTEFRVLARRLNLSQFFQIGWQRIQEMRRAVVRNLCNVVKVEKLSDELFQRGVVLPKYEELETLLNSELVGTLRKKFEPLDILFPEISPLWNNVLGFLPQRTEYVSIQNDVNVQESKFSLRVLPFNSLVQVAEFESLSRNFDKMLAATFSVQLKHSK